MTTDAYAAQPVRGTQHMVDQMGWIFRRPQLTLLEIAWRWIFAIPFLMVCWRQLQLIAIALPPKAAGMNHLDSANPWISGVQLGAVWMHYLPYVVHVLIWLAPIGALAWALMAGLGRGLLLKGMEPEVRYRPFAFMVLHLAWVVLLGVIFLIWYAAIQRIAAAYITPQGADLVGYSIWAIFVSLALFTLWAVISWPLTISPVLALLERRSVLSALGQSFKLGRAFTSELIEINLNMGIIKLMILVLAMVFSAAPLPFAQQLGTGALHVAMAFSLVMYCVLSDYFQVVRVKAFVDFWYTFRGRTESEPVQ